MTDSKVFKVPTQPLDLPSKGLVYPEDNPLSSGVVELYLPTAEHEDILTNRNYLQKGLVVDKFLQAIIASPIDYTDLVLGDKNAILFAARILAYGSEYSFKYKDPISGEVEAVTVDLGAVKDKEVNWSVFTKGKNYFEFILPQTKVVVGFKLLTQKDENNIDAELKGLQKVNKNISKESTTRLVHQIVSVDGDTSSKTIRDFVKVMPLKDLKDLRKYISEISPDIDAVFDFQRSNGEVLEGLAIPMTADFLWPDAGI